MAGRDRLLDRNMGTLRDCLLEAPDLGGENVLQQVNIVEFIDIGSAIHVTQ
jgi:hypothetical protein